MEELSLVISQPEAGRFLTHITWNKEELKAYIEKKVRDYQGLVYTEDTIRAAKADRAALNKLKKSISDRRIEVKKAVMAPYTEFEADVKEVLSLIEDPISQIDSQIKAYENEQREARKEALREYFEATFSEEFRSMVAFEQILSDSMLLASKTEKKACRELDAVRDRIEADLMAVRMSVDEQDLAYAQQRYLATWDVGTVFREIHELQERRKAEDARRTAQEAQEEPKTVQPVNSVPECTEGQETASVDAQERTRETAVDPFTGKIYVTHFTCYGTREQLFALRDFMVDNGIRFERIENAS